MAWSREDSGGKYWVRYVQKNLISTHLHHFIHYKVSEASPGLLIAHMQEGSGLSWDFLGTILGLSWDYLGTILGLSWDYLGTILGLSLGISWDFLGTVLGLS